MVNNKLKIFSKIDDNLNVKLLAEVNNVKCLYVEQYETLIYATENLKEVDHIYGIDEFKLQLDSNGDVHIFAKF